MKGYLRKRMTVLYVIYSWVASWVLVAFALFYPWACLAIFLLLILTLVLFRVKIVTTKRWGGKTTKNVVDPVKNLERMKEIFKKGE